MQDRPIKPAKFQQEIDEGESFKQERNNHKDKLAEINENSQEDLYDFQKGESVGGLHAQEESDLEKQIENLIKDKDFHAAHQKLEKLKDLNESNPVTINFLIEISCLANLCKYGTLPKRTWVIYSSNKKPSNGCRS